MNAGVLTKLDSKPETIAANISSRPYAEIKIGNDTVTLYGGILDRSIYYVATQNKDTFPEGSEYDKFVQNLIDKGGNVSGES